MRAFLGLPDAVDPLYRDHITVDHVQHQVPADA
jgi:hypothetical protein